jgi:lactosylceramide 4-alpha-galactosyltransferase
LSLWKYSGTYLDLDIVMLKPLDTLQPNYAGAESNNFVAAGIINLENDSGHEIADLCVKDLLKNFDGNDWGNNGPGVITRVLQQICNTKNVMKMISTPNQCKNFKVLPIESCYAIRWPEHIKFFKEEFLNETMERLNESIIAHVWNKHSAATPLKMDANVAYIQLAKKFCPKVAAESEFF